MEGNEGPPKKSIGQRLARIPEKAKKIYQSFAIRRESPLADEVEETEENERGIEVGDVAWAILGLNENTLFFGNGEILYELGVGESEKEDYFIKHPDKYRQVNMVLQRLVDKGLIARRMNQDSMTNKVSALYSAVDLEGLEKLVEEDESTNAQG